MEMTRTLSTKPESNDATNPIAGAPAPVQHDTVNGESLPSPLTMRPKGDVEAARVFAIAAARMLSDDRCEDIVVLDVSEVSQVTDFVIIASGTSDRQMRGSVEDVKKLAVESGYPVFRQSVDDRTTWCVLDCVDVVIHVFEPNTRSHYDLEMLWDDAPRVDWERPGDKKRDLAGLND